MKSSPTEPLRFLAEYLAAARLNNHEKKFQSSNKTYPNHAMHLSLAVNLTQCEAITMIRLIIFRIVSNIHFFLYPTLRVTDSSDCFRSMHTAQPI